MRRCVFHKEARSMKFLRLQWESVYPTAPMLIRLSELKAIISG
jgi:hypothetical protein